MAQQSAPPPHCKKLLEDGLETFLDHMSNVAETEAEKRVSYVNGDLLARTFWQPSNLLIVSHCVCVCCVCVCVNVCVRVHACIHFWLVFITRRVHHYGHVINSPNKYLFIVHIIIIII